MKALTLWQPWCWAITIGLKRVENRPWAPPSWLAGEDFALHAGMKYDKASAEALRSTLLPKDPEIPDEVPHGVVTAVARLADVVTSVAEVRKRGGRDQERWFFGPYGWILADIRQLPNPVACRGFQKLWTLPAEVEAAVRGQL
jgi:hypothetical protein